MGETSSSSAGPQQQAKQQPQQQAKTVRLQYNSPSPHLIGVVTLKDDKGNTRKAGPYTLTQGENELPADVWAAIKDLPDMKHYQTVKEEQPIPGGELVPLIVEITEPKESDEARAERKAKAREESRRVEDEKLLIRMEEAGKAREAKSKPDEKDGKNPWPSDKGSQSPPVPQGKGR